MKVFFFIAKKNTFQNSSQDITKHFSVALKSHETTSTSFDFVGKHSNVKPEVRWADICNFTERKRG